MIPVRSAPSALVWLVFATASVLGCESDRASGASPPSAAGVSPRSGDDSWPTEAAQYLRRELSSKGWSISSLWCDTTKCTAQMETNLPDGASARGAPPAWGGVVELHEAGDEGYRHVFQRNPCDYAAEGALRVSSFAWPDACKDDTPPLRRAPPWSNWAPTFHYGRFSRLKFKTSDAACRCECALRGIGEARGEPVECVSLESHPAQIDCRVP